jgi:uncharacterized cupredoxin-like copper-binding protein
MKLRYVLYRVQNSQHDAAPGADKPLEELPRASKKNDNGNVSSFNDFLRRIPIVQITERVKVTLSEGTMTLDTNTVPSCNRVVFHVKNTGKEPHHFVVAVTGFPPDKLAVKDGRVRYYTYFDEAHTLLLRDRGGSMHRCARGTEPMMGTHWKEPGVKIDPRKEVTFEETYMYDPRFKPGTSFVLFCNEPGHYERGECARVVVK